MTVVVAVGPTIDLAVVRTSCLRKPTFEEVKPLMIIKAWICLRVLRLVTVMPTLFLIMLPIAKHYLFFITDSVEQRMKLPEEDFQMMKIKVKVFEVRL